MIIDNYKNDNNNNNNNNNKNDNNNNNNDNDSNNVRAKILNSITLTPSQFLDWL